MDTSVNNTCQSQPKIFTDLSMNSQNTHIYLSITAKNIHTYLSITAKYPQTNKQTDRHWTPQ